MNEVDISEVLKLVRRVEENRKKNGKNKRFFIEPCKTSDEHLSDPPGRFSFRQLVEGRRGKHE